MPLPPNTTSRFSARLVGGAAGRTDTLLLTGNLVNQAAAFLSGAMTNQVQRKLVSSEGVLIQGRNVHPFHFSDDQSAELKLSPPFVLVDPA